MIFAQDDKDRFVIKALVTRQPTDEAAALRSNEPDDRSVYEFIGAFVPEK